MEAAVKNDQGMTSITEWLSQHRRQLHLNWTRTSLELLEVDQDPIRVDKKEKVKENDRVTKVFHQQD